MPPKKDVESCAERFGEVLEAIELQGVGAHDGLGAMRRMRPELIRNSPFKRGSKENIISERELSRAIAEWADGDSIAAHVAYNNDVFCTEDKGKSAGRKSILDLSHRSWLEKTCSVKFATIRELAQQIKATERQRE